MFQSIVIGFGIGLAARVLWPAAWPLARAAVVGVAAVAGGVQATVAEVGSWMSDLVAEVQHERAAPAAAPEPTPEAPSLPPTDA